MKNLFIFSVIASIIVSVVGGLLDLRIINNGGDISESSKLLGNGAELMIVWFFLWAHYWLFQKGKSVWPVIILIINTLLIWWMVHDVSINLGMGVGIDYIGQGTFDQFFGRICQQSGWIYLGVRAFWLLLGSLIYFSLTKNK